MTGKADTVQAERVRGELQRKKSKEIIHSGHFMVSDFEAEGRDEDEEVSVPVPEDAGDPATIVPVETGVNSAGDLAAASGLETSSFGSIDHVTPATSTRESPFYQVIFGQLPKTWKNQPHGDENAGPAVTIDQSLTKLFQCMSLAYSHKLTSPRWKNFKGLRLQWKDKIRLNNVIWRCWHMQFVKRQSATVCQFASPLDVDQHNKPEAVVLEGKYWKRKLATVTAEYKNWRIFYKNKIMGRNQKDFSYTGMENELNQFDWSAPRSVGMSQAYMGSFLDDDFFMDFSDTLFTSLTSSQPFPFPNPREIARGAGLADFIQPGLVQLQPNLEDIMDMDPLHDLLPSRLAPVEEEVGPIDDATIPSTSSVSAPAENNFSLSMGFGNASQEQVLDTISNLVPMDVTAEQNLLNLTYTGNDDFGFSANGRRTPKLETQHEQQLLLSGTFYGPQAAASVLAQSTNDMRDSVEFLGVQPSQGQSLDQQGFAVPRGPLRSRSRSGSSVGYSSSTSGTSVLQMTVSTSQPCLNSAAPAAAAQNGASAYSAQVKSRGRGKSLASHNSPVRTLVESPSAGGRSSRGRTRSGPNSQPVLPLASATTVPTHAVLPDNTLLAQLLSGPSGNAVTSAATALLLTHTNASARGGSQIPLLLPIATNSDRSAQLFGEKTVALLATQPAERHPQDSSLVTSPAQPAPVADNGSSGKNVRPKENERGHYREHRRVCHINAEQKRRCNIKNGFDTLQSLLPGLGGSASGGSGGSSGHGKMNEVSKAAMLHRGADYIRQLRQERQQQQEEMEQLRQNIEALNVSINECQAMLPATGVPISRQRTSRLKEMFDEWVRTRTLQNWKFWIFSIIIQPLLDSFSTAMASATGDDLCRLVLNWVDQHCSLLALRPAVLNSLRHLSKTTDILSDPTRLPAEATQAVRLGEQPGRSTTS